MSMFAFYVVHDEPWLTVPETCLPWNKPKKLPEKMSLNLLYIVQLAIWVVTCFCHRFVDKPNKDYYVMYIHHLVTIAIVLYSLSNGFMKYGLVIFLLHDVSDVFLDLVKLSNYLKLEGRAGCYLVEICYACLMTVWSFCRLFFLPYFVYHGMYLPTDLNHVALDGKTSYCNFVLERYPDLYIEDCLFGLLVALVSTGVLQILHWWWTYLLLRIGYKAIFAAEKLNDAGNDIYEGDNQPTASASTKPSGGSKKKD